MKRYMTRRTVPGSPFGGPGVEVRVFELANDKTPPEGAVEVPASTPLQGWGPETGAPPAAVNADAGTSSLGDRG